MSSKLKVRDLENAKSGDEKFRNEEHVLDKA